MFGVGVVKNVDPDKYVDSNYGIGFVSCSAFSLSDGSMGENVIIFGVGMSSSVYIDGKKKRYFMSWKRRYTRIR